MVTRGCYSSRNEDNYKSKVQPNLVVVNHPTESHNHGVLRQFVISTIRLEKNALINTPNHLSLELFQSEA